MTRFACYRIAGRRPPSVVVDVARPANWTRAREVASGCPGACAECGECSRRSPFCGEAKQTNAVLGAAVHKHSRCALLASYGVLLMSLGLGRRRRERQVHGHVRGRHCFRHQHERRRSANGRCGGRRKYDSWIRSRTGGHEGERQYILVVCSCLRSL